MHSKQTISVSQMYIFMYVGIFSTGILTMPAILYRYAEQNLWLSLFIGSLIGYLLVFINGFFYKHFPGKNVQEIIIQLLGPYIGRFCLTMIIGLFIFEEIYILREYQLYLSVGFYQFTRPCIIIGFMMLICTYACYKGIEVIARVSQIIFPLMIFFYIAICLLALPSVTLSNMLPILEKGLLPPIKGAIVPLSWFSEFFWLSFCLNSLPPRKKIILPGVLTVLILTLTLLFVFVIDIGVLGAYTGQSLFPSHVVVRYIELGTFVERVSAFFMSLWVLGMFIKICFLLYVILQGVYKLGNFSNRIPVILCVTVTVFTLSLLLFNSTNSLNSEGTPIFYIICQLCNIAPPILLYFLVLLKKKLGFRI